MVFKYHLARNKFINSTVQLLLAKDDSYWVKSHLADNPSINWETILELDKTISINLFHRRFGY